MSLRILPAVLAVLVGCDRRAATVPAVVTVTVTASPAGPAPPPKIVGAQPDPKLAFREEEEKRLAGKEAELRLMSSRVQDFVRTTRAVLAKRPFGDEALGLSIADVNAAAQMFNAADLIPFYVFIGESHQGSHLAGLLGLDGKKAEAFKAKLGMLEDPSAVLGVQQAIREVTSKGLGQADPDYKKELRERGFAEFLTKVKD